MKTIAFVGNPNTGKTALINAIAKSDLEVGNWPGVTVEKKEAHFNYKDEAINIIDLPGTYTFSPYSLEEKVTRDYLAYEAYDGIINVLNATNLRRNLYLTLALIDMQKPMVLALNMFDDFKKRGYDINIKKLEEILGICITPTIASKSLGSQKLLETTIESIENHKVGNIQPLQEHLEKEIHFIEHHLQKAKNFYYSSRMFALKLLENDPFVLEEAKKLGLDDVIEFATKARQRVEKHMGVDISSMIAHSRYKVIDAILDDVFIKPVIDKVILSEKIDNIILHPTLAFPIFAFVMYLLFKATFTLSMPLVNGINDFFTLTLSPLLQQQFNTLLPTWLTGLLVDGVLSGVGLLLSFLPLLFFLYLFMSILQESGYMARVSFLLDNLAKKLGIKGNAFVSLIIGFGCNVPAIYGTRSLTSYRERILTTLMIPLMSCSGRLPIYALFVGIFFQNNQALIVLSLYSFGIVLAFFVAYIGNKILPVQEEKAFFLELPTYHLPNIKSLWVLIKPNLEDFIFKAGRFIVVAAVVLWAVISLPLNSTPQTSYLAQSAKVITPLFKPVGFGEHWEPIAALIPGTLAKEVVVGSLGSIYGIESKEHTSVHKEQSVKAIIASQFSSKLAAYSYLLFVLIYIPCISTIAAIKQEFGTKMMLFEVTFLPLLAYTISLIFYQVGLLLIK